jgi:YD repeat-containing protein
MALFWNSNPAALFWGNPAWLFWQEDATTCTYDALGRLTEVTFLNGTTIQYNYDHLGNRTSVVTTCGGSGC